MKYHQLGGSDLKVSNVCLGNMTWGEYLDESAAHQQMDMAFERGVNFVDTAEMYPVPARAGTQGSSERFLGSWLSRRDRSEIVLASKVIGRCGMKWIRDGGRLDKTHIRAAVEASLSRLKTDYIDLYQIHWPDRYVPKFGGLHFEPDQYENEGAPLLETIETMDELIREGKIRAYGLSNETPYGVGRYLALAEKHDLPKPITIQNCYNMLNRVFEISLLETCWHHGIELLPYSVLAFGFLTGKYRGGALPEGSRMAMYPEYGQRYKGKVNMEEAVEAYAELAGDNGLTRMALQWVASRSFAITPIIGANSMEQLEENLDALEESLPDDLEQSIDAIHFRFPNPCP